MPRGAAAIESCDTVQSSIGQNGSCLLLPKISIQVEGQHARASGKIGKRALRVLTEMECRAGFRKHL